MHLVCVVVAKDAYPWTAPSTTRTVETPKERYHSVTLESTGELVEASFVSLHLLTVQVMFDKAPELFRTVLSSIYRIGRSRSGGVFLKFSFSYFPYSILNL